MSKTPEQQPFSPENQNLYQTSQERKALRRVRKDARVPESVRGIAEGDLAQLNVALKSWSIEQEGGLTAAKERLRRERQETKHEQHGSPRDEAILEALGQHADAYRQVADVADELAALDDFVMHQMLQSKIAPAADRVHQRLVETARQRQQELRSQATTLEEEYSIEFRAHELVEYAKGLYREGHIAPTPSVRENLHRIGRSLLAGKPMFLHGPTGIGKTSLARFAAERFTGKRAEMVYCNPQTRESAVWGKTGIRPAKEGGIETVDIYGPLARAMQEGKPVIFDEFTALPVEQMVFIKGIFNAQPGDTVNVVGNGEITIAPGFQMIFTANLKSEKNPERQELPPEIAREFEQYNIKIDYQPEAEVYDTILARMMKKDGSVQLSWHDLQKTLPKLCAAIAEIQTAYTATARKETARLIGAMDASGKTPALKKLVMTQGTIRAIVEDWNIAREETPDLSFSEHLDQRLKIGLTFEEYPEADRILAAKILASKGLLRTLGAQELNLPTDVFDFDVAKRLRGDQEVTEELLRASREVLDVPLYDLAELDPFGIQSAAAEQEAEGALAELGVPEGGVAIHEADISPEAAKERYEAFLQDTFRAWYNDDRANVEQAPLVVDPRTQDYEQLKSDVDAAKFGEYTVNPETQGLDFEQIPKEKVKVLDLAEFQGRPLHEVARHVMDEYGDTHYIPGIELWEWVVEHYDSASEEAKEAFAPLTDGNWHHFFGSAVRHSDGDWDVPDVKRGASDWERNARWLVGGWGSDARVVLLEK